VQFPHEGLSNPPEILYNRKEFGWNWDSQS
jgi:hypothetical protein